MDLRHPLIAIGAGLVLGIGVVLACSTKAEAAETGSLVVVEEADCDAGRFSACDFYTFHSNSATIGDFTLRGVRANRNYETKEFSRLNAGTYVLTQQFADKPLESIICRNGEGRRAPSYRVSGSAVVVDLRTGETVTCTFTNREVPPTPAPTQTPVPTATVAPTQTPVPTFTPAPVVTPVIIKVCASGDLMAAGLPCPTVTPVATPAVVIKPPATGSAGLVNYYRWPRFPAYWGWDDEGGGGWW